MSIETLALGGDGGKPFDIEAVEEIGLRSGKRIDALLLNGERRGGRGGSERESFTLMTGEYIDNVVIRHGRKIDRLELSTNFGRRMAHGGGGGRRTELKDVRVLGFGGRSGAELDKLRIHYIKDYSPSKAEPGLQTAIIGIVPAGEKIETFVSSRVSRLNSTRRLFETTFSAEQTSSLQASVSKGKGEFLAKSSRTFGFKQTVASEFIKQVETEEVQSETVTRSPAAGMVGLETVQVEVFRIEGAADGLEDAFWTFPVGEPEYIEVREEIGVPPGESAIDMTGVLGLQLPVMAGRQTQRYGRDFYPATT